MHTIKGNNLLWKEHSKRETKGPGNVQDTRILQNSNNVSLQISNYLQCKWKTPLIKNIRVAQRQNNQDPAIN